MKERTIAYDFTRAFCTMGIVVFHFSCSTAGPFRPLLSYANGYWGGVLVNVFFMLSGGLLFYNNQNTSLKIFYYKRWKAIFPSFYIAYVGYRLIKIIAFGGQLVSPDIPARNYLFSLLGIDGYVSIYGIKTYYALGEWFLGGIIICYIVFPIFINISKKHDLILVSVLFTLTLVAIFSEVYTIPVSQSIVSALLHMQVGITFVKRKLWNVEGVFAVSTVICLIELLIRTPLNEDVDLLFFSPCLFVVLTFVGRLVMRERTVNAFLSPITKWSYQIFLVHHVIIHFTERIDFSTSILYVCALFGIIVLSIVVGCGLFVLTSKILESKPFVSIERRLIDDN